MEPQGNGGVNPYVSTSLLRSHQADGNVQLDAVSDHGAGPALHGRYELMGELGHGGMSTVYLALDRLTGEVVAVKSLDRRHATERDTVRRLAAGARHAATLRHPNIVRTLAVEETASSLTIVNEYVEGDTLRTMIERTGPLPIPDVIRLLRELSAALAYAHARRIVHRDVKPANILIERDSRRALLADFGIARDLNSDERHTMTGLAIGTPAYMSPEQIDGRSVDERADVYALGMVGWEMLAGRAPWQGETLYSMLYKQQNEKLPDISRLRPDIPVFLLRALEGALEKDRDRRWRDGAALLEQLDPTPVAIEPLPRVAGEAAASHDAHAATVWFDRRTSVSAATGKKPRPARFTGRLGRQAVTVGALLASVALLAEFAPRANRDVNAVRAPTATIDPQLQSMLALAATIPTSRPNDSANLPTHAVHAAACRSTAVGRANTCRPTKHRARRRRSRRV